MNEDDSFKAFQGHKFSATISPAHIEVVPLLLSIYSNLILDNYTCNMATNILCPYFRGATFPSMLKTPSVTINFRRAPSAAFSFSSRSENKTKLMAEKLCLRPTNCTTAFIHHLCPFPPPPPPFPGQCYNWPAAEQKTG